MGQLAPRPQPMVNRGRHAAATWALAVWQRRTAAVIASVVLLGIVATGMSPALPDSSDKVAPAASPALEQLMALETDPNDKPPVMGLLPVSRDLGDKPLLGALSGGESSAGSATDSGDNSCIATPLEPGVYRITSPYGPRAHPIFGARAVHTGIDMAAPLRTPIHAVASGTVLYAGPGRMGRSSELIIIEHEMADETFYSWTVHMYPDGVFVRPGEDVTSGQRIAEVGNNGNSTGPHLHLEIHTAEPGFDLGPSSGGGGSSVPGMSNTVLHPGARHTEAPATPTTMITAGSAPSESEAPTDEESESPTPCESASPRDDEQETPSPCDSEPPTDGPTDEPTEDPTDESSEPPTEDPTGGPTDEPTEDPTDESSKPPTDEPTETPGRQPSESPSTGPRATSGDEAGSHSAEGTGTDSDGDESVPFPMRAYGTTVDPLPYLRSLTGALVSPSQCRAA